VDVSQVTSAMEYARSKVNFIILDACRNNPFERSLRGGSRGLAAVDAAAGTLIACATAPGSVSRDGEGATGTYTEALLSALSKPGLKAAEVFKQVRIRVSKRIGGQQIPWESSSLTGEFVFNSAGAVANARPQRQPQSDQSSADREVVFWKSVKDSDNPDMLNAYLERYPRGEFGPLARIRLRQLASNNGQGSAAAPKRHADSNLKPRRRVSRHSVRGRKASASRRCSVCSFALANAGCRQGGHRCAPCACQPCSSHSLDHSSIVWVKLGVQT
jgi:hypothetical protein